MARYIAQLIMLGSQAIGRAFSAALREEYRASMSARVAAEEAGRSGTRAAKATSLTGITLTEAKQILDIQDIHDLDTIRKNYEHLFQVNGKESGGGSFYLQSKVVRAKERIELELNRDVATTTPADESSKQHENRQR